MSCPESTRVGTQPGQELDVFADQSLEHLRRAGDGAVDIEQLRPENLAATERQKLSRQPRCTLDCTVNLA